MVPELGVIRRLLSGERGNARLLTAGSGLVVMVTLIAAITTAGGPGTGGTPTPTPTPVEGFPSEATTGVPGGTSLTAYSGANPVTTNGVTIDGKTIGCLVVNADNVTITNSRITCASGYALYIEDDGTPGGGLTVEDTEIICNGASGGTGIGEADFTLTRVEVTGCENGCDVNRDVLIEESLIHNLNNGGGDPHEDGCQMGFGHFEGATLVDSVVRITFRHNRIEGVNNTGGNATSAIISYSKTEDILIEENLLTGGSYTLYCSQGPGATSTNFQVLNNHFGNPVPATGRSSGCSDETQSGNVVHETLSPLTLD